MKKLLTLIIAMPALVNAQAPCIVNSHSLNLSSAYVQLPSSTALDITDSITVEAWIYPTSFGTTSAQNSILCKHGWSQGERGYVFRCGGAGILSFNIAGLDVNNINQGWQDVQSPANALILNTWQHVAASYDGDSLRLFVNGIQVAAQQFTGSIDQSNPYTARIGRLSDPGQAETRYFSGRIDEVRVWHRSLNSSDLLANYNHHITVANVTGLAGYWRFNEGAGTYTYDSSGNSLTGQLMSALFATQVPFNEIPPQPTISYVGGIFTSSATSGNQWFFAGNSIPGATQQTYQPLQPGTYNVMVTAPGGCTNLSNPVTVNNQGILENNAQSFAQMLQNSNTIEITLNSGMSDFEFFITDATGKVVANNSIKGNTTQIQTESLSQGLYFITLTSNGRLMNSKFVK
mgnify:CR=1 FL=1